MKWLLTLLTISTLSLYAQENLDDVKAPILRLFDGMKMKDTAMIRSALVPGAMVQSVTQTKEGEVVIRTGNFEDFLNSIAKAGPEVLDERIQFGSVQQDGALASVWTPYQFYVGEKFSHCGANSFQLVRLNGQWKIQYVIDTRRKTGCQTP